MRDFETLQFRMSAIIMPNGVPAAQAAQYVVGRSRGQRAWRRKRDERDGKSGETGGEGKKTEERRTGFSCGSGFPAAIRTISSIYRSLLTVYRLLLTTILTLPFPTKIVVF